MPVLTGAIAYRASPSDQVEERIGSWRMTRDDDEGPVSKRVLCRKCGEPYIVLEGVGATDEIMQDDIEFLAKALSTAHPSHPAHMVIRDPGRGVANEEPI